MKNKSIAHLFLCIFGIATILSVPACAQDEKQDEAKETVAVQWTTKLSTALEQAENSGKMVMLEFVTSDCSWCDSMQANTLQNQEALQYLDQHYVPCRIPADVPGRIVFNGQELTIQQFIQGLRVSSFPTYMVLFKKNQEGDMQAVPFQGYHSPEDFIKIMTFFVDGSYGKMSFDDYRNQ